jgi:GDP-4-dehydro-6-deoxy-D-mannose reductase
VASSGAVYGNHSASGEPCREDGPCVPVDPYGLAKIAAEEMIRGRARAAGVDVVFARIFNVAGPGQAERHVCGHLASALARFSATALPSSPLEVGDLTPTRDFIDVRDAARALALLGRRGSAGEAYNVAAGREIPIATLLDKLLALARTGAERRIVRRKDLAPSSIVRQLADVSRLRSLGFEWHHSIDSTLRDLLEYYLDVVATTEPSPAAGAAACGH